MKRKRGILTGIFAIIVFLLCMDCNTMLQVRAASETKRSNPFSDVKATEWYYPYALYALDNQIMSGKGQDAKGLVQFDPVSEMTRAEFVQVLYNKEGKPEVDYKDCFADVKKGDWYAKAICWASENKIVAGKGNVFDCNASVTRQEIVTMLYNYACNYLKYDTSQRDKLDDFKDCKTVSPWAEEYVKWAVYYGIIEGKGENCDPLSATTRAEGATVLRNFISVYELPEQFDLRSKINIRVEEQGDFGLCWDFAAMKCLETNLALTKGEDYDFSEIHVAYMMSEALSPIFSILMYPLEGRTFDGGGNFSVWLEYNLAFHGFLPEEELEYREYDVDEYRTFTDMKLLPINVSNIRNFTADSDKRVKLLKLRCQMKEHIMKYGAIWAGIEMLDSVYVYADEKVSGNHAVAIIGWDDHFPKEKFVSENGKNPERDGAFIALNSWGTKLEENGLIYISYEDMVVYNELWGIVSAADEDLIRLDNDNEENVEDTNSTKENTSVQADKKGKKLLDAIRTKYPELLIEKDGKQYINPLQISDYYVIDLSGYGLSDLEGIEIFSGCQELILDSNQIEDLTPLKNMNNLIDLSLADNQISDVSALISLKKLARLNLTNNSVKDISVLKDCKELYSLTLDGNEGIKGYHELTYVESISLADCSLDIKDMEAFSGKKYNILNLSGNFLGDKAGEIDFHNITSLSLRDCGLTDIPEMNTNMNRCDFSDNPGIKDFSGLKGKTIGWLGLCHCNIRDGGILPSDLKVRYFDLSYNPGICNLGALSGNVERLVLMNCGITDVSVIGGTKWDWLDLSENKGLYGTLMTNHLDVRNCGLDDSFDFLGNKKLDILDLQGNDISVDHIAENFSDCLLYLDPISFDDFKKLPEEIWLESLVVETVYLPSVMKEQTIQLKPIIEYYFSPEDYCPSIEDYQNMLCDRYVFTGKVTGDEASVTFNVQGVERPLRNCNFELKIEFADQLKEDYLKVYNDDFDSFAKKAGDKPDFSKLKVEKYYEGGYSEFVYDYEIIGDETLKSGANKYVIKSGGLEKEIVYYADYYTGLITGSEKFDQIILDLLPEEDVLVVKGEEETTIRMNEHGKAILEEQLRIPSGLVSRLGLFNDSICLHNLEIVYDGEKITSWEIAMLMYVFHYTEDMEKPVIVIYNTTEDKNEDIVIEQDSFIFKFINEEPPARLTTEEQNVEVQGVGEQLLDSNEIPEESTEPESSEALEESAETESSEALEESVETESSEALEESAETESSEALEESAETESSEALEESAETESSEALEESAETESSEALEKSAETESSEALEESAETESSEALEESAEDESSEALEGSTENMQADESEQISENTFDTEMMGNDDTTMENVA